MLNPASIVSRPLEVDAQTGNLMMIDWRATSAGCKIRCVGEFQFLLSSTSRLAGPSKTMAQMDDELIVGETESSLIDFTLLHLRPRLRLGHRLAAS